MYAVRSRLMSLAISSYKLKYHSLPTLLQLSHQCIPSNLIRRHAIVVLVMVGGCGRGGRRAWRGRRGRRGWGGGGGLGGRLQRADAVLLLHDNGLELADLVHQVRQLFLLKDREKGYKVILYIFVTYKLSIQFKS